MHTYAICISFTHMCIYIYCIVTIMIVIQHAKFIAFGRLNLLPVGPNRFEVVPLIPRSVPRCAKKWVNQFV
jgi:hypothetical protein